MLRIGFSLAVRQLCVTTVPSVTSGQEGLMWLLRHQRHLRRQAELMQEAVRNRDFMFRLPTRGLLPGERAMQEVLNQMGGTIRQQVNQILINLTKNAIEAGAHTIGLEASGPDQEGHVRLFVSNDGEPIPAAKCSCPSSPPKKAALGLDYP